MLKENLIVNLLTLCIMNIADLVNGMFVGTAGFVQLINVVSLCKAKEVKGVNWFPTVFFTVWGGWNLYYYQNLSQSVSEYGAISIMIANSIYVFLIVKYKYWPNFKIRHLL